MDTFHLIPIGSIYALPAEKSIGFLDIITTLPESVKNLVSSATMSAYISGLGRSNHIAEESVPIIAFAILRVAIGKLQMSELSTILAQELNIDIDTAVKMASEIDQDLFAPIQGELDAFLAGKQAAPATKQTDSLPKNRTQPTPSNQQATPRRTQNVLDLKELGGREDVKELTAKPTVPRIAPRPQTINLKTPPAQEQLPPAKPTPVPPKPPVRNFPLPPLPR